MGGFSSATPDDDRENQFSDLLGTLDGVSRQPELLWLGCGRHDFLFQRNNEFSAWLKESGNDHTYRVSAGGHTWMNWRSYQQEFLPLLFR